jgi:uncharacterized protein YchJ
MIKPIEEVDMEFSELIKKVISKEIKARISGDKVFDYNGNEILYDLKLGRNDLCLCESGLKFKKCCGR